ncbi:MAG: hypothetical protein M0Z61_09810 [Nitrospiraceae bacterium]|nr:hypothetical protein [Nitrospiraceae bacterium]
MLIDWYTVVAQILNFIILVWLLKRFLYKPVTEAMDRREKDIAGRLDEAKKRKEEAGRSADEYIRKISEIEGKREEMLRAARIEADGKKEDLLDRAREEVEEEKAAWLESLEEEKISFLDELRRKAAHEAFAVSRQSLRDIANSGIEKEMIGSFKKKMASLDEKKKEEIGRHIVFGGGVVIVRSAFDMPDKKEFSDFLQREIGSWVEIKYEISPKLISGIEVNGNGYKVAWNLKEYLDRMEEKIGKFIEAKTETGSNE